MADGFEAMVDEALAFFRLLARNNSKEWFDPRKAHYKDAIAGPAAFFADLMAEDLARLTGVAHSPKVYRIYRDVRFSKDKTPLNTHLHLMWTPAEQGPLTPSWFWGLSPDYFVLGLGVMGLQGEALNRYRAFVDRHGDAVQSALGHAEQHAGAEISGWGPEPLKRVPKPYDPAHPHSDLLKRKALAVTAPMGESWRETGVLKTTLARADAFLPLWRALTSAD